jgi:cytochrome oxidase assembly protein ShyY1
MSPEPEIQLPVEESPSIEKAGSTALRIFTWFSVGIAVAVVGIYVGAELRNRSRFKRRTPYDFYSNAGEHQASEFGVGI